MVDYKRLKLPQNKTTPQNVEEANKNLFSARWNLPTAARHCGMSEKEMKMTFWEFLKYNKPTWGQEVQLILPL